MTGQAPASRYASRNLFGALFGPSVGTITDVGITANAIFTGDIQDSHIRAMRRLFPVQNLVGVRTGLDMLME